MELTEREKVLNKNRDELVRTTAQHDQAATKVLDFTRITEKSLISSYDFLGRVFYTSVYRVNVSNGLCWFIPGSVDAFELVSCLGVGQIRGHSWLYLSQLCDTEQVTDFSCVL
jgi:hypothetical protein